MPVVKVSPLCLRFSQGLYPREAHHKGKLNLHLHLHLDKCPDEGAEAIPSGVQATPQQTNVSDPYNLERALSLIFSLAKERPDKLKYYKGSKSENYGPHLNDILESLKLEYEPELGKEWGWEIVRLINDIATGHKELYRYLKKHELSETVARRGFVAEFKQKVWTLFEKFGGEVEFQKMLTAGLIMQYPFPGATEVPADVLAAMESGGSDQEEGESDDDQY